MHNDAIIQNWKVPILHIYRQYIDMCNDAIIANLRVVYITYI